MRRLIRRTSKRARVLAALSLLIAGGSVSLAAQETPSRANPVGVPPTSTQGTRNPLSDFEFWLSVEVLLFGFAVICLEYLLLRRLRLRAEDALRVFAVTLIVVGTLFAVTAGFGASQVAPAMGLFGTIAGYLLGKRREPMAGSDLEPVNVPASKEEKER